MRKIILAAALALVASLTLSAQNVASVDAQGNYVAAKRAPKTEAELLAGATATGKTYTDADGKAWPVYTTANGKTFALRTSKKTGNPYRFYFTADTAPAN